MTRRTGHLAYWLVLLCGVAADVVSKNVVFRFLSDSADRMYDVWPGVFRFSMHYNTGGPFSLFAGRHSNAWLIAVNLVALSVVVYLYLMSVKRGSLLGVLSLAMIAAGALGNLSDRMTVGCVRDFIDVYAINYPVFNVADMFVSVGAFLLIIELLRGDKKLKPNEAASA